MGQKTSSLPRISNPRMFCDGIAWLKLCHKTAESFSNKSCYGTNPFKVKKRHLLKAIALLIQIAGPGLTERCGELHTLKCFWDEQEQCFTAVLIYEWFKLPSEAEIKGPPPFGIIPKHFYFMWIVDACNWKLSSELEGDAESHAKRLFEDFHKQ